MPVHRQGFTKKQTAAAGDTEAAFTRQDDTQVLVLE